MRTIGTVARLQIQRGSLKTGEKPTRRYDPAPLLSVPKLNVTPEGALGAIEDDAWVVDVHHRAHPHTKNERSEEHTSELQSLAYLVCRLLLEKKKHIVTEHCDH